MGTELKKAFSWEIDNFSERTDMIKSDPFSSGGCNWCLKVHPKGYIGQDGLILFLGVGDVHPESLRRGWKRRVRFCFVFLDQSGQELYRTPREDSSRLFCHEVPGCGRIIKFTLNELQEKGFLENNQLRVEIYMNVLEVVHQVESTVNDMVDFHGVQIPASQFGPVDKTFKELPDFGLDLELKRKGSQRGYMKQLICLIQTLIIKPPHSLSLLELSNAQSDLSVLTEAGFKLDWLRSKLEEASLAREKARVQQLEERVKNVELDLSDLKVELEKEKIKSAAIVSSFEFIDFLIKRVFLCCFSISKH
ncbi:unnamed protein product [Microthlaspi erraticum]|uniref:MATH domain-containing protein n=1 Tax=Microthlaspi erraticum TaxID=1685480 RepID=A0A6D2INT1_9BRAS|nr:unnamed protein product [Microthlaspi erraticum]